MADPRIARMIRSLDNFNGVANLYEMTPPHDGQRFVIASAARILFDGGRPETYLFPATEAGEVIDWCEMDGSTKDTLDHSVALGRAGYTVTP